MALSATLAHEQVEEADASVAGQHDTGQDETPVPLWLLVGLMLLGLLLRLRAPRGLWVDEVITVDYAHLPLRDIAADMAATSVHPPLHTILVAAVGNVVGFGEFGVRLPSLIAGVLLIPVIYALARELFSTWTAVVAAAIATVQPFLIWYSQEARSYELTMLLATLCLLAQVYTIRRGSLGSWVAFTLLASALMWTHYFTVFQLAAQLAIYAYCVHRRMVSVKPLVASLCAVAVLVVPLVSIAWSQTQVALDTKTQTSFATNESLSVYSLFSNLLWGAFGFHPEPIMVLLAAMWPLGMLFLLFRLGRRPERATVALTGIALASIVGLMALSTFRRELFEIRYFALAVPPLLIVSAHVIANMFTSRTWRLAGVVAAVLIMGAALLDQQLNPDNPRRYDFREALAAVQEQSTPNDIVLAAPVYLTGKESDDGGVVGYYLHDRDVRSVTRSSGLPPHDGRRSIFVVASFLDTAGAKEQTTKILKDLAAAGWRNEGAQRDWSNVVVWKLS